MGTKNFLLLSLEDSETKRIANIVGNESCKKILDFLSQKEDSTESEISKKLDIPISTVHYNLNQLMRSGLVNVEEFHYSKKGKEVNHYKLANKYIIITPKKVTGIRQKLRNILPVALICGGFAALINFFPRFMPKQFATEAMVGSDMASEVLKSEVQMVEANVVTSETASFCIQEHNIALWFLIGAMFAIIVYVIISWIKNGKTN